MTEFKTMTLKQCGQYDKQSNAGDRLTGWGKICKDRYERGISRRVRILLSGTKVKVEKK